MLQKSAPCAHRVWQAWQLTPARQPHSCTSTSLFTNASGQAGGQTFTCKSSHNGGDNPGQVKWQVFCFCGLTTGGEEAYWARSQKRREICLREKGKRGQGSWFDHSKGTLCLVKESEACSQSTHWPICPPQTWEGDKPGRRSHPLRSEEMLFE